MEHATTLEISSRSNAGDRVPVSCPFEDTHWTQILSAGQCPSLDAALVAEAKGKLCGTYWPTIYSYLRRHGHSQHDAEDLTQQFFIGFLAANSFSKADRAKGRFRNFLLGALKNFLSNETRRTSAQKRGGDISFLRIDCHQAEEDYRMVNDPSLTPDQVYDRRWATALLMKAWHTLRAEFKAANQLKRFDLFEKFLSTKAVDGDFDRLAQRLKMTPKAVDSSVTRFRQRYREIVRHCVANTLSGKENVDGELHDLFVKSKSNW